MDADTKPGRKSPPFFRCIDAGTEYCPCALAELGECVMCPLLCGHENCDCDWNGTCIFQEYQWCRKAGKRPIRKSIIADVLEKETIHNHLLLLRLEVGQVLAEELCHPGSFVFLKKREDTSFFEIPLAVMSANAGKGEIQVLISVIGPKTKRLENCGRNVSVRGPYWNGIFGSRNIENTHNENCLVILDGTAQASGPLPVKRMLRNGNSVAVFLGKKEPIVIRNLLPQTVQVYEMDLKMPGGKALLSSIMNQLKPACVFSGGDHRQHMLIRSLIAELEILPVFAISNNQQICCGEGICGSCTVEMKGKQLRTCKACLNPEFVLNRHAPLNAEGGKTWPG